MKKLFTRILSIGIAAAMMTTGLAVNSSAVADNAVIAGIKTTADKFHKIFNQESGQSVYIKAGVDVDIKYFAEVDANTQVTSSNRFLKITKHGDSYHMAGSMNKYTSGGQTISSATFSDVTVTNGRDSMTFTVNNTYVSSPATYLNIKLSETTINAGELFTVTGQTDSQRDYLTWIASNDNIRLISDNVMTRNMPIQFKAVREGKTTLYCMTASGLIKSIDLNIGSAASASTNKLEDAPEPTVKAKYGDGYTQVWFKAPKGTTLRCTYNGSTPSAKTVVYNGNKFKFSTEKTFKVRVEREGYKPAVYTYTKSVIGNSFETLEKIHSRTPYMTDYTKHPAYIALNNGERKFVTGIISGEYSKYLDQLHQSEDDNGDDIYANIFRHYGIKSYDEWDNAFNAKKLIEASQNAGKSFDELFETYLKNRKMSDNEAKKAKALAKSIVEKALKEASPYAQIKSIHDSLCDIAQYDSDRYDVHKGLMKYDEYKKKHPGTNDILVNGLGVCADYTDVFTLLCNAAGYECVDAGGAVGSELHDWNAVKLEGTWYYVDTTWGDLKDHYYYVYFLKGYDTLITGDRHPGTGYIDSIASRTDYKK